MSLILKFVPFFVAVKRTKLSGLFRLIFQTFIYSSVRFAEQFEKLLFFGHKNHNFCIYQPADFIKRNILLCFQLLFFCYVSSCVFAKLLNPKKYAKCQENKAIPSL